MADEPNTTARKEHERAVTVTRVLIASARQKAARYLEYAESMEAWLDEQLKGES